MTTIQDVERLIRMNKERRTVKSNRLSRNQRDYLAYVKANPDCSIADIERACRWNPRAGHAVIYDGVNRLIDRGFLRVRKGGCRKLLTIVEGN